MAPNADKIITAYLNANLTESVVGSTPGQVKDPWVRLTVLDDQDVNGGTIDRALECYVQLDCYAGKNKPQGDAKTLSLAVRELLRVTNERAVSAGGGYIYAARVSFTHALDPTFEPAMECYRGTGTIWVHS